MIRVGSAEITFMTPALQPRVYGTERALATSVVTFKSHFWWQTGPVFALDESRAQMFLPHSRRSRRHNDFFVTINLHEPETNSEVAVVYHPFLFMDRSL